MNWLYRVCWELSFYPLRKRNSWRCALCPCECCCPPDTCSGTGWKVCALDMQTIEWCNNQTAWWNSFVKIFDNMSNRFDSKVWRTNGRTDRQRGIILISAVWRAIIINSDKRGVVTRSNLVGTIFPQRQSHACYRPHLEIRRALKWRNLRHAYPFSSHVTLTFDLLDPKSEPPLTYQEDTVRDRRDGHTWWPIASVCVQLLWETFRRRKDT